MKNANKYLNLYTDGSELVEAVEYTPESENFCFDWLKENGYEGGYEYVNCDNTNSVIMIRTYSDDIRVDIGDWIVRHVYSEDSRLSVWKPCLFTQTFNLIQNGHSIVSNTGNLTME